MEENNSGLNNQDNQDLVVDPYKPKSNSSSNEPWQTTRSGVLKPTEEANTVSSSTSKGYSSYDVQPWEVDYRIGDSTPNVEAPKKSKVKTILLIVGIVLVIVGIIVLMFILVKNDNKNNKNNDNNTNIPTKKDDDEENPITNPIDVEKTIRGLALDQNYTSYKNTLTLYIDKNKNDRYIICSKYSTGLCDTTNKNKTYNIKVKDSIEINKISEDESDYKNYYKNYKDKYIVYSDEEQIKIYFISDDKSYYTGIKHVYSEYSIVENEDAILGILAIDSNNRTYYYSLIENALLYDNYSSLELLSDDYLSGKSAGNIYILSTKENKIINDTISKDALNFNVHIETKYNSEHPNDKYYFLLVDDGSTDSNYVAIYGKDFKKIVSFKAKSLLVNKSFTINSSGNLLISRSEKVTTYKNSGEVIKTEKYKGFSMFIGDYIVLLRDNKLILVTPDGSEVVFNSYNSKKQKIDTLFSDQIKINKEEAIAIFVSDDSVTAEEMWNGCNSLEECEYTSKTQLESEMKNNSNGYYYFYIIGNGTLGRIGVSLHM